MEDFFNVIGNQSNVTRATQPEQHNQSVTPRRRTYPPSSLTQAVDRALSSLSSDFGPPHIKLLIEWDQHYKKRLIQNDKEEIDIHPSVEEARHRLRSQGNVSLDECFNLYTQEERLLGDDAWLCPHCKKQQQGTIKSLGLWSLPDVLVLHLKRFKQDGTHRSKLNTLVDFPVDALNMSSHLIRNSQNDVCVS